MKITAKTIKNEQYPIEVPEDVTVGDFKQKVSEASGVSLEALKIVAKGKVLSTDEQKLSEYNIGDGDFVVMMQQKPKVQKPADAPKPNVSISGSAAASDAQPGATTAPATTQPPAQPAPVQQQPTQPTTVPGGLPPGVTEDDLSTLVGITNKPRDFCLQILAATKNLEVACQVIFEGITPQQLQQLGAMGGHGGGPDGHDDGGDDYGDEVPGGMPGMGMGGGMPPMGGMPAGGAPAQGGAISQQQAAAVFQQFAGNPLFRQVVDRLRSDPSFYTEFMQQLQTQNPMLAQTINQHPMMFMNLLMAGDPNAVAFGGPGMGGGMPAGMGGGMPGMGAGMGGPPGGAPGGRQIQVTPAEMEAIQRLETLGFQRAQCLEAIRACDGNEEHAADFLFTTAIDDEQDMMQAAAAQSQAAQAQAQVQPATQAPATSSTAPATDAPATESAQQEQPQPGASGEAAASNDAQANNNNNNEGGNDGGAGPSGDGAAGGDASMGDGGDQSAFDNN